MTKLKQWWKEGAVAEFREQYPMLAADEEALELDLKFGGEPGVGLEAFIFKLVAKEREKVIEEIEKMKQELIKLAAERANVPPEDLDAVPSCRWNLDDMLRFYGCEIQLCDKILKKLKPPNQS